MKLAFRLKDGDDGLGANGDNDNNGGRKLRVTAPNVTAQAVPGIYLLYVVDRAGVPSVATRVDVRPGE